jgi:ClpP class serine protease
MKINHVISSILKGNWLIDQSYAHAQLPVVLRLLDGKPISSATSDDLEKNQLPFLVLDNNKVLTLNADATAALFASGNGSGIPVGVTAVIPIKGAILKEDNCGDAGSMTRARQITNLSNNDNISSIILLFDSPGGMVDGTQSFADAINNAKKKKPVMGFVEDGMAASAAYWFASQCTELYASHETSSVGSIGVFVRLLDVKPAYAKEGFVIHEIYADGSEEKNLPYKEALDSKYELIKTEMLNPIRTAFVAAVQSGRGNKIDAAVNDPFKGKMFGAKEAIKIGLIDGIMSFDAVVARAAELANKKPTKTNSNQSTNIMKLKTATHAALIAMLNISVAEGQTETAELTESQMNDLNAAVVALQGQVSTAEQSITALNTEKETLTASLTKATADLGAANTSLTTANAEVTRLKAFEPPSTVVTQDKTDADDPVHNDADMEAINNLPHNKALNGNPLFN